MIAGHTGHFVGLSHVAAHFLFRQSSTLYKEKYCKIIKKNVNTRKIAVSILKFEQCGTIYILVILPNDANKWRKG